MFGERYDVHPLVLAVLQAVHHATAHRRPPFYVSVVDLDLALDDRNAMARQSCWRNTEDGSRPVASPRTRSRSRPVGLLR
jgi:hypothetical protein